MHPMRASLESAPTPSPSWARRLFGRWWRSQSPSRQDRFATLGPLVSVESGAAATHEERWFLFKDVADAPDDAALEKSLAPLVGSTR